MILYNFGANNYFINNDLWVTIYDFTNPSQFINLKVTNTTNGKFYEIILYPNYTTGEYTVNFIKPVRALFDAPNHLSNPLNTKATFVFELKSTPIGNFPIETSTITRRFFRGGQEKEGQNSNSLNPNTAMFIGDVYGYAGFDKYHFLDLTSNIVKQTTTNLLPIDSCAYKMIKFLNSKGGYQFYAFESFEIRKKTKPLKNIAKYPKNVANAFRNTNFQSLGVEANREIELFTETSQEKQLIIDELISSFDVLMYDQIGNFWIKLVPSSNTSIFNPKDKTFKNKISFDFYSEVNNSMLW